MRVGNQRVTGTGAMRLCRLGYLWPCRSTIGIGANEGGRRLARSGLLALGRSFVPLADYVAWGIVRYQVVREADLTAVVYDPNETVTANFPLKKGDLDEKKAKAILGAITQALSRR
jgi:hypothetical protein